MTEREIIREAQAGVFRAIILAAAVIAMPVVGYQYYETKTKDQRIREAISGVIDAERSDLDSGRLMTPEWTQRRILDQLRIIRAALE